MQRLDLFWISFYVCGMWTWDMCLGVPVESEDNFQQLVLSSAMWILGLNLWSSSLGASTHKAISLTPVRPLNVFVYRLGSHIPVWKTAETLRKHNCKALNKSIDNKMTGKSIPWVRASIDGLWFSCQNPKEYRLISGEINSLKHIKLKSFKVL